ncbi:hypothetical protein A6V39_05090 [Candidatus Mycoplasma haematobovis]|uniref:Uncharacterized protein n=1 Tax=Candidatus Mycoplasma haematobovis TaxID=432608 RepID=A0A1A9QBH2_9MOLU|nr:hypothetical protein [Candidatus Mycoplasma haematobovis]OAL09803.1 hypothetical protein A6V39_05090 [Candidatus Mycoplasma haematobovis]
MSLGNKIVELIKQYNSEKKVISSFISFYSEKWRNAWNKYLLDNKGKYACERYSETCWKVALIKYPRILGNLLGIAEKLKQELLSDL